MEARLLVKRLELLLFPTFGGLNRVLVKVAPTRLDRLRSDTINFRCGEQLQRTGHKSLASSWGFLFNEEGRGREFRRGDQRRRDNGTLGGEILVVIFRPGALVRGGRNWFIQGNEIRVISYLISTISGLGFPLFFLHDGFKGTRLKLGYLNFGVNAIGISTRLSQLSFELQQVQMLQFRGQVERQLMRVT